MSTKRPATTVAIIDIGNRGDADFGYIEFSDGVRVGYRRDEDQPSGWQVFGGGDNWPEPDSLRFIVAREYLKTYGPVMLERTIDIDNQGTREQPWGSLRISDGTEAEFALGRPGVADEVTLTLKDQTGNTPQYIKGLREELVAHLAATDWTLIEAAGIERAAP
jgi:hypothetical protein